MRALFWLILLFSLAVMASLLLGNNPIMLTMYWPPDKAIDFSLNFALLVLALVFVLLHLVLRSAAALRKLPQKMLRWRMQKHEQAVHTHIFDAMSHYLAGRFVRARKSAEQTLRHDTELHNIAPKGSRHEPPSSTPYRSQLRTLAQFMVAQSSHALQERNARDEAMVLAQKDAITIHGDTAQETRDGLHLRCASWLLDDNAPQQAMQQLEKLPQGASRRAHTLRIKLKVARSLGRNDLALETARALVRHKGFSEAAGKALMAQLASDLLSSATDPYQLESFWKKLNKTERAQPEVALQAAQRMIELQGNIAQARLWLLPVWEIYTKQASMLSHKQRSQLIHTLQTSTDVIDNAWLERIEAAHLREPQQAELQYLMGIACMQRELWGKAQQLLTQATQSLQHDKELLRNAWRALASIAEAHQDTEKALVAWRQAALTW